MYIQKGNPLTRDQIAKALTDLLVEAQKYKPRAYKTIKALSADDFNWQFGSCVAALFDLHEALWNGHSVWASVEHRTKNANWYSIYFVKDNKREILWIYDFFPLFYAKEQNRHPNIKKWVWDGYGVVEATNYVFTFFKRLGGCYAQIEL